MAATVYPDAATSALLGTPPNTPIALAAAAGMSALAPLVVHLGSDMGLPTTFIRISMSGAASPAAPQVELSAVNPTAMSEGPAVVITGTSVFSSQALLDGENPTDAANAFFSPADFLDNVYLLKVVINIPGTTFKLRITNNTAAAREFVWVVGDSLTESQRPWVHATPSVLTYDALINQDAALTARSLQVANRGTGPLEVTNLNPVVAAPFAVVSGLPVTIAPNATANIALGFNAPAVIGTTAAVNHSLVSNDAGAAIGGGHNASFSMSALTRKLEVALALDDSGSMSWGPNGEDPPLGGPSNSRWSELRSATKIFLEQLAAFGENRGTFGIVKFPGTEAAPVTDLTSYDLVAATTIPAVDGMQPIEDLLDATEPFYKGTPMSYALERLQTAPAPFFATDPLSVDTNIRCMLVMSDGAWNSSPDPRTRIAANAALKIKVFAAGYGIAGEVDYPTMEAISTGPGTVAGGLTLQVNGSDPFTPTELAAAFKTALKTGLTSISSPLDPDNTIDGRNPEARHPVVITPYDTRAVFSINWNTPNAQRLELQLITPTCELITPERARAGGIPGVKFSGDLRHQLFVIDRSYLKNAAKPSQPRYGTWRMVVTGRLDGRDSERYSYDVLTESSLRLEASLDRNVYYAGDAIAVTARLTLQGAPLTNAAVKVEIRAPQQARANWLAAAPVTEAELKRAATTLAEKEPTPLLIKATAAGRKGIRFNAGASTTTVAMPETEKPGVYAAKFTQTATPDSYKFHVVAVGTTPDGTVFRRERMLEVVVGVRPDPKFTLVDIDYAPLLATQGFSATLRITPRDRFGNLVLFDPATSKELVVHVVDGKLGEQITTNLDGTYAVGLSYARGARPTISIKVGGTTVISRQPLAPLDQQEYVDQVTAFKPGAEAVLGANRYTNPKACLGDFSRKQENAFVSLGAYGSIAVGIRDRVALAQGDADVTVFVQPDTDPRPYIVEALPPGLRKAWQLLGKSAGTTQSFSFRDADLKEVAAIRITDSSGRTRTGDLKPSASPGVSIRAVGFASTGKLTSFLLETPLKDASGATMDRIVRVDSAVQTRPDIQPTRFLGNSGSRQVHDLEQRAAGCQIDEIRSDRRVFFATAQQAHELGYDNCAYCLGRSEKGG